MEGVCRPLKVRIEQVLTSDTGLLMTYRLSNLLQFYMHTITNIMFEGASLCSLLVELHTLTLKVSYFLSFGFLIGANNARVRAEEERGVRWAQIQQIVCFPSQAQFGNPLLSDVL